MKFALRVLSTQITGINTSLALLNGNNIFFYINPPQMYQRLNSQHKYRTLIRKNIYLQSLHQNSFGGLPLLIQDINTWENHNSDLEIFGPEGLNKFISILKTALIRDFIYKHCKIYELKQINSERPIGIHEDVKLIPIITENPSQSISYIIKISIPISNKIDNETKSIKFVKEIQSHNDKKRLNSMLIVDYCQSINEVKSLIKSKEIS